MEIWKTYVFYVSWLQNYQYINQLRLYEIYISIWTDSFWEKGIRKYFFMIKALSVSFSSDHIFFTAEKIVLNKCNILPCLFITLRINLLLLPYPILL